MGKQDRTERADVKYWQGNNKNVVAESEVRVSRTSDPEANTRAYHGTPSGHVTEHKDGSLWKTDSSGTRKISEGSSGGSGK